MSLRLDGVSLVHANGLRAINDVRCEIRAGEHVAVIGPSGAGKSTLLRLMSTALRPSTGVVQVLGTDPWHIKGRTLRQLRARIGMVYQAPPLPARQRVVTAVLAGRLGRWPACRAFASLLYPADVAGARAVLARMEIADKLFERCDRLSGGQLQRVGVARTLYQQPDLLLADEPVSAVDPALSIRIVSELIRDANARGNTLVASLHAVDLALQWFPRIIGLRSGEVAFDLPPGEVTEALLGDLYASEQGAPVAGGVPSRGEFGALRREPGFPEMRSAGGRWIPEDPAALPRLALTVLMVVLLVPGFRLTEFDPGLLFDPHNRLIMGRFMGTFLPFATAPDFLRLILKATLVTLAMATTGMAIALLIGCPLALLVARSLSVSRIGPGRGRLLGSVLRVPPRLLLMVFRSIPEIVWALLFVRAVGLGPAAGVLAIGVAYGGMLGKVYAEILESGDARPAAALLAAGAGRFSAFLYGLWPVALPELLSYSVYRWECAVRASVIMGFVGAGGLGQQMDVSMRMLNGGEVSSILLVFLMLVMLADGLSALLRRLAA